MYAIRDDYRWLLLAVMVMLVHYFIVVGGAGALRGRIFDQEFMDENYGEEHLDETGKPIEKGGYPDHGSGRYTMEAGYKAWLEFNCA